MIFDEDELLKCELTTGTINALGQAGITLRQQIAMAGPFMVRRWSADGKDSIPNFGPSRAKEIFALMKWEIQDKSKRCPHCGTPPFVVMEPDDNFRGRIVAKIETAAGADLDDIGAHIQLTRWGGPIK